MPFLLARIERGLAGCETAFLVLANLCLGLMLVGNTANMLARGLFDKGIVWVFPWSVVLFVWMSFFGFYVVYRRGNDVTVDYLHNLSGPQGRKRIRLFANLVVVTVLGSILWQAPKILKAQVGDIELTGLERWTMSVPLFLSSALILVDVVLDTLRALRNEV
jgi:TRAP-type C4-dicarboxylate transport system permease small subunit